MQQYVERAFMLTFNASLYMIIDFLNYAKNDCECIHIIIAVDIGCRAKVVHDRTQTMY